MSIVVGLGIARILSGFSSMLEFRRQIQLDWPTVVWSVNVLGYHLLFWWIVVNNWRFLPEWTFPQFASLFLYGVFLFFCASLILPPQFTAGMDLRVRFESIRRPFYVLWLLVMCSELLDSFSKGTGYVLTELGPPYLGVMSFSLTLSVAGIIVADRRFHVAAAIAFFVVYAAWVLGRFATI